MLFLRITQAKWKHLWTPIKYCQKHSQQIHFCKIWNWKLSKCWLTGEWIFGKLLKIILYVSTVKMFVFHWMKVQWNTTGKIREHIMNMYRSRDKSHRYFIQKESWIPKSITTWFCYMVPEETRSIEEFRNRCSVQARKWGLGRLSAKTQEHGGGHTADMTVTIMTREFKWQVYLIKLI